MQPVICTTVISSEIVIIISRESYNGKSNLNSEYNIFYVPWWNSRKTNECLHVTENNIH